MPDRYKNHAGSVDGPAVDGFAIAPSDGTPLAETTRALYVGGTGDLTLVLAGGTELAFANVPAGALLPVRATAVKATGTTATNLVGLL